MFMKKNNVFGFFKIPSTIYQVIKQTWEIDINGPQKKISLQI